MKPTSKSNEGYGERGPSERCPARWKAKVPVTNPEGWHLCQLKRGHPGPHECVHGEVPEGVYVYQPGPDHDKLIAMP